MHRSLSGPPPSPLYFRATSLQGEEMHPSKLLKSDSFDPNWPRRPDQHCLALASRSLPHKEAASASLVGGSCSPKRGLFLSSSFLILLPEKPFSLLFF